MPMPMSSETGSGAPKPARRRRRTPEAQRKAILEAATEVFLERGYAGATIDAVVERAGGSKATVYAQFGNKEGLFTALVTDVAEHVAASIVTVPRGASLEESLCALGRAFLDVVLAPSRVAIFRLVVGESGRRPEIGDIFYRIGPASTIRRIADVLRECAARGLLESADFERLAASFVHLLLGEPQFQVLFNPTRAPTAKEIAQHVDFAVGVFLYGCGAGARQPAEA
jgi:AcrR family transcriptional regulator